MIHRVRLVDDQLRYKQRLLFSQFRARVYTDKGFHLDIGRASFTALDMATNLGANVKYQNDMALEVGDFCEFALCTLVIGGEHKRSDGTIQYTFNSAPILPKLLPKPDPILIDTTHIGSGCILSQASIVLGGARLGLGCIVAAGSVVPKKVFSSHKVIGGVPARIISRAKPSKVRIDGTEELIYDLKCEQLIKFYQGQRDFTSDDLSDSSKAIAYKCKVVDGRVTNLEVTGTVIKDEFIPTKQTGDSFQRYVAQLSNKKMLEYTVATDLEDIV